MAKPNTDRPARAQRRRIEGQYFERAPGAGGGQLADTLRAAQLAQHQGGKWRSNQTYAVDPNRHPYAAVSTALGWRTALPDLISQDGRPTGTPQITRRDETATIRTATIRSSACLAAGAHLIEIPEGETIDITGGQPAIDDLNAGFEVIQPAQFAPVDLTDGEGTVPASAAPIARAKIDRGATEQLAVRFEVNRSMLRTHGPERIEAQLMRAIPAGLGVALDGLLLRALATATGDGTVSGASVVHEICGRTGIRWSELAAVVGQNSHVPETHGTTLHIGGVHAEHSAGAGHTIAGAWDRCALAVSPEVMVLIERRDASGKLMVTAFCDAMALIPAPEYFEEIGADAGV